MNRETFAAAAPRGHFLKTLLLIVKGSRELGPVGFHLGVREFLSDIRQNQLGLAWTFLSPLIYVAAFVFARGTTGMGNTSHALSPVSLLSGLILYQLWFDSAVAQMTTFSSNSIFIKNIGIKTDVFFYAGLVRSVFVALPKLAIVLAATCYFTGFSHTAEGTLPYLLIAAVALLNGAVIGYFLAPITAIVNDVKIAFHSLSLVMMFASLVFMKVENFSASERLVRLLRFNPVAVFVDTGRSALHGDLPVFAAIMPIWAAATLLLLLGALIFNRLTRPLVAERL
jgi:ABC-type polysaccharide/polyol phosphate export permease